jgi:hypothetical protein
MLLFRAARHSRQNKSRAAAERRRAARMWAALRNSYSKTQQSASRTGSINLAPDHFEPWRETHVCQPPVCGGGRMPMAALSSTISPSGNVIRTVIR